MTNGSPLGGARWGVQPCFYQLFQITVPTLVGDEEPFLFSADLAEGRVDGGTTTVIDLLAHDATVRIGVVEQDGRGSRVIGVEVQVLDDIRVVDEVVLTDELFQSGHVVPHGRMNREVASRQTTVTEQVAGLPFVVFPRVATAAFVADDFLRLVFQFHHIAEREVVDRETIVSHTDETSVFGKAVADDIELHGVVKMWVVLTRLLFDTRQGNPFHFGVLVRPSWDVADDNTLEVSLEILLPATDAQFQFVALCGSDVGGYYENHSCK